MFMSDTKTTRGAVRVALAVVLALGAALSVSSAVAAHAFLDESVPARDAVVDCCRKR